METKKLLLIVNPCSGRERMRGKLLDVVQIFSDGGYDVTVYTTKERGDATARVESLNRSDFDIIVVSGGDGTLNEVITGLMRSGRQYKIGYIPAGTLNEWSMGLKISRNFLTAARNILNGREILLDIGRFDDRFFSYTASFGAFTEASYTAPQESKNALGQAAYFFEGIKSLPNIRPVHLKAIADDREIEGDFLFGAVSNSMSVGGIVKFSESLVKLNDGYFEVLLIHNPKNIMQFQQIFDGIVNRQLEREGIEFFHTKKLTITGGSEVAWTLDGEYAPGSDTVVIENIPSALHLMVPEKG